MNMEINLNEKKGYIRPSCDVVPIATECIMVEGSGNLPGGSTGHDMGSGDEGNETTNTITGGVPSFSRQDGNGLADW